MEFPLKKEVPQAQPPAGEVPKEGRIRTVEEIRTKFIELSRQWMQYWEKATGLTREEMGKLRVSSFIQRGTEELNKLFGSSEFLGELVKKGVPQDKDEIIGRRNGWLFNFSLNMFPVTEQEFAKNDEKARKYRSVVNGLNEALAWVLGERETL